ncbi:DUF1800 domain-containing protein [Vibrio sp. 10N.261.55.A7]|uniref:DUF1800 domain-containing protein n=1 Tax=Vibrio sp. 10N.261.55.A7 TaxID=1880851 RepID=UPI000C836D22|nr:DUF1800 domain-containing protein [Vibrio sp. 10N.261.55.A7]
MTGTQSTKSWMLTCLVSVSLILSTALQAQEPYYSDKQIYRFLEQTTFGPTEENLEIVRESTPRTWLKEQIDLSPTLHHDLFQSPFPGLSKRNRLNAWYQIAIGAEDQFRQRAAYALSQVLVVSQQHKQLGSRAEAVTIYYDVLVENAFSNYRELLEKVTLHAAMGSYLSMNGSKKSDPSKNSYPDENYAREVMQLFTIGLHQLNQDGSLKLKNGQPIPNYGQEDIEEIARAFTGWKQDDWAFNKPMITDTRFHDYESKTVLGNHIPAWQTPEQDVKAVLDILFNHPSMAPFVSRLLIQRLVSSNPSPAYIERIANVFDDNGDGVRGDLEAIFTAIILDPEAQSGDSIKIKEPIIVATHFHRAFSAEYSKDRITDANRIMVYAHQKPLGAASVFNFYSPNHMPTGVLTDESLLAPEVELISWANYVDLVNYLATYAGYNPRYDLTLQLDDLTDAAFDSDELVNLINQKMFGSSMSLDLKTVLLENLNQHSSNASAFLRVYHAVSISLASDDFFIQN